MALSGLVRVQQRSTDEAPFVPSFGAGPSAEELTALLEAPARRRTRLCDLSPNLHCSIVGTCLSTGELRSIVAKAMGRDVKTLTDHEIHGEGVLLAQRRDPMGKLLHKALDKRHQLAINQFARATTADAVAALWAAAKRAGEIPGGYWAVLSHPATTEAVAQAAFADVHMLSHLVGAANRADIRRLAALEQERAALEQRLEAAQSELQTARTTIRALETTLAEAAAGRATKATQATPDAAETGLLRQRILELEDRLRVETARRCRAEDLAGPIRQSEAAAEEARKAAEDRAAALAQELAALEAQWHSDADAPGAQVETRCLPVGVSTLLYVGGRPNQVHRLRDFAARAGMTLLHHDGGFEDRPGLLAGLVSRADVACFPVDCVSHDAVAAVKRFCRQAAKPYLPLRSVGLGSFMAGLARLATRPPDGPES
ncbi:MAG: DUF2325 domain-containing protein [Azospirillaceae bacterium]|nr:DUF2325 domain-containing protein [Azospirillaceae bacterium]